MITSATQLNSSRVFIFDVMRIILIFLVVHFHLHILVLSPLDVLSRFELYAVPLFLVLSFYLTAKYFTKDSVAFADIHARTNRLLIPLIFWSLIGFLPHLELFTLSNVFLQILTGELVNPPLYYLNLLIVFTGVCCVLTYVRSSLRVPLFYTLYLAVDFR